MSLVRKNRTASSLTLVTRNTKDFEGIDGLAVVNPWHPD